MTNDTTKERHGAPGSRPAGLDTALAQAEWMRLALVMLEGSRSALEFQRTMVDFSLEMLRQQQDAAFAAMRNAMQGGAPGVPGLGAGAVRITEPPRYCEEKMASTSEVIIKMPAAAVVSLPRKLPGPRGPNTVWLAPPNAAPIPAPLPACNRTIRTKAIATTTWMTTSGTYSQPGTPLPPLKRGNLCEG